MEKRTPHYRLARVKDLIRQGAYRVTRTALHCAAQDFSLTDTRDIASSVGGLASGDFYKSMTTYHDSRIWQDVYRPMVRGERAYVKMQIVDDTTVVISFKRLEDG